MENIILTLHIAVCVLLIIFVLLQSGKEGMGVIFGGGSSSLFGSTGAGGILVRLTAAAAIIFFCTSLGYSIITSGKDSKTASRIKEVHIEEVAPQAAPAPAPLDIPAPAEGNAPASGQDSAPVDLGDQPRSAE